MIHQGSEAVWHRFASNGRTTRAQKLEEEKPLKTATRISLGIAALCVAVCATQADEDHIRWKKNGAPTETYITGGPWTLEQSGAANGLKSSGQHVLERPLREQSLRHWRER
jgi:hypothetical protein